MSEPLREPQRLTRSIAAPVPADFTGAIEVVRSGVVLHSQAYGMADIANDRPNRIDTRFPVASGGKALVAVAIMRLVADGRLSLNARLGDLLAINLHQISPDVTVRQLLNHTSGIPDYFDESVMDDYAELWVDFPNYRVRTNAAVLPLFIDKPMAAQPGTVFQYNNSGYIMLALIIEQITGKAFDDFIAEVVFAPAGMTGSGYFELDRLPANCANAYVTDETTGERYLNIFSVDAKGTGAGGVFLPVGDVVRFWEALRTGRLFPLALVAEMLKVQARGNDDDGDDEFYGYGFWLGGDSGQVPYIMGADPGVSFISSADSDGLVIVVVSNTAADVWEIHGELSELLAPPA